LLAKDGAAAPAPALPPNLSAEEDVRWFRLLHSLHPPCSYSRQALDAEARVKKANRHAAGLAPAVHKRPSNVITIKAPPKLPSAGAAGLPSGMSETPEQRAAKNARKEARRRERERERAALGAASAESYAAMLAEEEAEEHELADEEELLSESEEQTRFYEELEARLKRARLHGPERDGAISTAVLAASPSSATSAALRTSTLAPSVQTSSMVGVARSAPPPPPGAKVGYMRGCLGRGSRMWIETLVIDAPPKLLAIMPPQRQQQQQQQQYHNVASSSSYNTQQQQQLLQQQQYHQQQLQLQQQQQQASHHPHPQHGTTSIAQHLGVPAPAASSTVPPPQFAAPTHAPAVAAGGVSSSGPVPMDLSSPMPPAIRAQ
jgi:hypothetical protein